MTIAKHSVATALLALALFPAERALSWGPVGHQAICQVAAGRLSAAARAEVERLAHLYKAPDGYVAGSFAQGCTFADTARAKSRDEAKQHVQNPVWKRFLRFNEWHFLNVPRDTQTVEASDCGKDCVLRGIEYHTARLGDKNWPDWKRAEALIFLGHWIGDVHQPLHISYRDDTGGNEIRLTPDSFYYVPEHRETLHAVWDSGIIALGGYGGWQALAVHLQKDIEHRGASTVQAWLTSDAAAWAQESYAITVQPETEYCSWQADDEGRSCDEKGPARKLTSVYQGRFRGDVELRLEQAGVRLAQVIEQGLRQ